MRVYLYWKKSFILVRLCFRVLVNASGVQLVILAWDLNSAMDREIYATGMQVTDKKTGINVFLGELCRKNYNKFRKCLHL